MDNGNDVSNGQPNGYLIDSNGNKCLRRVLGLILLCTGVIFGFVLFWYGLNHGNEEFDSSYSVMQLFMISGAGLLGLNVFENLNVFSRK